MRSIANRNEALGLPPVADPGSVYVSKDDARDAQSMESKIYGGQVPKGGMAAQMQVSDDAWISRASRLNGIIECCGQIRTRQTFNLLLVFWLEEYCMYMYSAICSGIYDEYLPVQYVVTSII